MISRYFGSKTQEFPVPDDEAPLRLLLIDFSFENWK